MGQQQTFTATPTLVGNKVEWTLCHTNPNPDECGNTKATYPEVILNANAGTYDFKFTITNDNTGLGIKFADEPIWVKRGTKDPSGPSTDPQIPVSSVMGKGTPELTLKDLNNEPNPGQPNPVVLKYRLNFVDSTGRKVDPIDPDITNGGTNTYVQQPGGGWGFADFASAEFMAFMAVIFIVTLLANIAARYIQPGMRS